MIYVATHDQAKQYKSRVLRDAKQRGAYRTRFNHTQTNRKQNKTNHKHKLEHMNYKHKLGQGAQAPRQHKRSAWAMSNKRQTHKHKLAQQTRSSAEYKHNRKLILQDKPNCHWCNQRTATTADHLIEVDRWDHTTPGINSLDNLVPACKQCNSSRGARYGNLKKLNIYETPPTININAKKINHTQRFFLNTAHTPTKHSAYLMAQIQQISRN